MSSPLEDFIIQLGFDTSKITKQFKEIQSALGKVADDVDKKRVEKGLKREKKIADAAVAETKKAEEKKQKAIKQSIRVQDAHIQQRKKHLDTLAKQEIDNHNMVEKALAKNHKKQMQRQSELMAVRANAAARTQFIESAKRQQAVRALLYPEKNPQLKAMGNFYRQEQANQSQLGIANERRRNKRAVSTLTNLQAFAELRATDRNSPERKMAAQMLVQVRELVRQGKLDRVAQVRRDTILFNRQRKERMSVGGNTGSVSKAPTDDFVKNLINARVAGGGFGGKTQRNGNPFLNQLELGLSKQQTERQAKVFAGAAQQAYKYRGIDKAKVDDAVASGNIDQLRSTVTELGRMNAQLERTRRHAIGAAAAMGSLHDSTRNMVREYASLYALLAGTNAINQTGQAFEALNSAMLAATGNKGEAQAQMQFMIDLSRRLGLSVKDIADQYIKFKFAAKGKLETEQIEELFTNMSEMGTVLGVSQERMKLAFNAISQINSNSLPLQ